MFSNFGVSFKEPSTWQGIITVLTLVGISLDPVQKEVIVSAGIALYAFLDVFWLRRCLQRKTRLDLASLVPSA